MQKYDFFVIDAYPLTPFVLHVLPLVSVIFPLEGWMVVHLTPVWRHCIHIWAVGMCSINTIM